MLMSARRYVFVDADRFDESVLSERVERINIFRRYLMSHAALSFRHILARAYSRSITAMWSHPASLGFCIIGVLRAVESPAAIEPE
jgi:hypothetical protein